MKRIDPTERALDAYFQLDTDQRATFALALKHVTRLAEQIGHSVDYCRPKDETKRGRPKGSKNRKAETPSATELELRHNNGAAAEGL